MYGYYTVVFRNFLTIEGIDDKNVNTRKINSLLFGRIL